MSKVSEHLFEHHKAMHQDRADAIANHQAAMSKEAMSLDTKSFHKAEIARHQKAMEHHAAKMEECSKAVQAEDLTKLDRLMPTRVSAIAPDRPRITPVLRTGQRELPAGFANEPELTKIFGLSEEDQNSEELSLQKRR